MFSKFGNSFLSNKAKYDRNYLKKLELLGLQKNWNGSTEFLYTSSSNSIVYSVINICH